MTDSTRDIRIPLKTLPYVIATTPLAHMQPQGTLHAQKVSFSGPRVRPWGPGTWVRAREVHMWEGSYEMVRLFEDLGGCYFDTFGVYMKLEGNK
jgi:hypothetical protein